MVGLSGLAARRPAAVPRTSKPRCARRRPPRAAATCACHAVNGVHPALPHLLAVTPSKGLAASAAIAGASDSSSSAALAANAGVRPPARRPLPLVDVASDSAAASSRNAARGATRSALRPRVCGRATKVAVGPRRPQGWAHVRMVAGSSCWLVLAGEGWALGAWGAVGAVDGGLLTVVCLTQGWPRRGRSLKFSVSFGNHHQRWAPMGGRRAPCGSGACSGTVSRAPHTRFAPGSGYTPVWRIGRHLPAAKAARMKPLGRLQAASGASSMRRSKLCDQGSKPQVQQASAAPRVQWVLNDALDDDHQLASASCASTVMVEQQRRAATG